MQLPQWPVAQPSLTPVRRRSSRSTFISRLPGAAVTVRGWPLTVSVYDCFSDMGHIPRAAAMEWPRSTYRRVRLPDAVSGPARTDHAAEDFSIVAPRARAGKLC